MKITIKDLQKKLTETADFIGTKKFPPDALHPEEQENPWYSSTSNSIKRYAGRLMDSKEELAGQLESLGRTYVSKYKKGHDNHISALNNHNNAHRLARLVRAMNENGLEIHGLDEQYWNDANLPDEVLMKDYEAIREGRFAETDGDFYRKEKADEKAKEEAKKLAKEQRHQGGGRRKQGGKGESIPDPGAGGEVGGGGKFLEKINFRAIFIGVGLLILLWIGWGFWKTNGGNIMSFLNSTGESAVETTSGTGTTGATGTETQGASGETGPTGSGQTGQSMIPQMSESMVGMQLLALKIQQMFMRPAMLAVLFLITFQFYKVFMDRSVGGNPADFPLFAGGLLIFAAFIWIPVGEYFFPGQGLVTKDGNLITIRMIQDWLGLAGLTIYLIAVSGDGIQDLTPLSTGLIIAGWLYWLGQPDAFLTWIPPDMVFKCWGLGAILHLLELFRNGTVVTTLLFVIGGIVFQFVSFFTLFNIFGAVDMPLVLKYGQLLAFLISEGAAIGIVGFLLTGIGENKVIPINGVAVGKFFNAIKTVAHDAAIMVAIWGGLFLALLWK